jgi:ParB family chromosome partitioning protein
MGKLDELKRGAGGNGAESLGAGVHRAAPPTPTAPDGPDRWTGVGRLTGAATIPLERIARDPGQPREAFPEVEMQELADSIRARGVLQPLRVRWDDGLAMYVVVAGERRWRAARMTGLAEVPCVVHDKPLDAGATLLDQLAENMIRLELRPVEMAKGFRRLMELNGWSARRVAAELSLEESKVAKLLRLLDLPDEVQEQVAAGTLGASVAYEVAKAEDPAVQVVLARRAVAEGLNRDQVVAAVRRARPKGQGRGGRAKGPPRPWTSRTPAGRVTVEWKPRPGADAIVEALEAALARRRAELEGATAAAAGAA